MASATDNARALLLFSVFGQALSFAVTLRVARLLPADQFELYAVCATLFLLMLKIAPLGADKLALKVVPVALAERNVALLRGYLGFALRRALAGIALGLAAGGAWLLLQPDREEMLLTLAAGWMALPMAALVQIGTEVLTGAGLGHVGVVALRVVVPLSALVLVSLLPVLGLPETAPFAIGAWTLGWVVALAVQGVALLRRLPPGIRLAEREQELHAWRGVAGPLWLTRVISAVMAQSGLLALAWSDAAALSVSAYVAAVTLVTLVVATGMSANRLYNRDLSLGISQGRAEDIRVLLHRRSRRMRPVVIGFVVIAFAFAGPLLRLFDPDFVAEGMAPLRLLSVAAASALIFSLAPTFLIFRGEQRHVIRIAAGTFAAQTTVLVFLAPDLATASVAAVQATFIIAQSTALAWYARRSLAQMERSRFPSRP